MFLGNKTKEEISELAVAYSNFDLKQIVALDKQLIDATDHRVNFGMVLSELIEQAKVYEQFEHCAAFSKVKGIYDLFVQTLILKKDK